VSYRSVALALGFSLASAGLAAGCALRASSFSDQAAWLLARGTAEAAEYTSTFDGRHVDQELATFQERRAVLERAHRWQGGATALAMISVLAVVAGYLAYLLVRLQEQRLRFPEDGVPASRTVLQVR
jgi:hypothetical protein